MAAIYAINYAYENLEHFNFLYKYNFTHRDLQGAKDLLHKLMTKDNKRNKR